MIVFLDFDGVVHPEGLRGPSQLFCRLPLIEEVLREFAEVELVISSAWRLEYADPQLAAIGLKKHFSKDIAQRVVGVTPDHSNLPPGDMWPDWFRFSRHWECEAWIRTHRPLGTRWLAADDREYLFRPFSENLMRFHSLEAFTPAHQDLFRRYLKALTEGTPWPRY